MSSKMPKWKIDSIRKQNAVRVFDKVQHEGTIEFSWLWLNANSQAINAIGTGDIEYEQNGFANYEDDVIQAVMVTSIYQALLAAKTYWRMHPEELNAKQG